MSLNIFFFQDKSRYLIGKYNTNTTPIQQKRTFEGYPLLCYIFRRFVGSNFVDIGLVPPLSKYGYGCIPN